MNRSRIPLHSAAPGDSTPKVSFPLLGAYVYGEDNPLLRIYAGAMVELPTTPPKHIERRA